MGIVTFRRGYILILVAIVLVGCSRKESSPAAEASNGDGYFKTHFQDESQFIVEEVLTDVGEMAFYAKNKRLPDSGKFYVHALETSGSAFRAPKYEVTIRLEKQQIQTVVDVKEPIWSPEVYHEAVGQIFKSFGVAQVNRPPGESDDQEILKSLLDPRAEVLAVEDITLSKAMSGDFTNPKLHEQAAFLLGTFSMRESSGDFYDVRLPLCRMTAHLAFARGLAGDSEDGIHGQVAMAQLFLLMNNQTGALQRIKALKEPQMDPWIRLLRARATHDYRELKKVSKPTMLENIECFRAYCVSVDTSLAWDAFNNTEYTQVPDFCRIVNQCGFSVQLGHAMMQYSIPMEMKELSEVYQAYQNKKLEKEKVVEALNQMPARLLTPDAQGKVQMNVIGWGQWSLFCQRHLCNALHENFRFLNGMLGDPESAKEFTSTMEKRFSGLYLFPFARRYICLDEADYHKAEDEAFPLTVATPHLISPQIWNYICYKPSFAQLYVPAPNPHINEWHKHNPPPGTVYTLHPRLNHPSLTRRGDSVQVMEQLLAIAPYDGELIGDYLKMKYPGAKPTYEQLEPLYHRSVDYNVRFMEQVAGTLKDKPEEYERMMLKAAKFNPCLYLDLGNYFVQNKKDDKGAEYLAVAMKECQNAVASANQSEWLIDYYFNKGEKEKAYKLADFAADDVYSFAGLRAKANLLEMDGKWMEALEYRKKMEERYRDKDGVIWFYLRYRLATGDTRYDSEMEKNIKTFFPRGLEEVTPASFKEAPQYGVLLNGDSEELKKAGLSKGDIIMAAYGKRIYDTYQFSYLREVSKEPGLRLIVWKNGEYAEVKANPPKRKFGVPILTYDSTRSQ